MCSQPDLCRKFHIFAHMALNDVYHSVGAHSFARGPHIRRITVVDQIFRK